MSLVIWWRVIDDVGSDMRLNEAAPFWERQQEEHPPGQTGKRSGG